MLQGMFWERCRSLLVRESGLLDTVGEPIFDRFGDEKAYLLGLARQASMALDTRRELIGDAA